MVVINDRQEDQRQVDIGAIYGFPDKYKSEPVLVQTIRTQVYEEKREGITGFTTLDKALFVISETSSEVEVFDSVNFNFRCRWNLKELINPADIVSCNINKCLYIADHKLIGHAKAILRVDPNGKLIRSWSTGKDYGFTLSVTDESNVILTACYKSKLIEYSPEGQLLREIELLENAGIRYPLHVIKLTNGHFLVSHDFDGRRMQRVCVVDADGKLMKSFGRKAGQAIGQMNLPYGLAVDEHGFVMVADKGNGRVFLLNSDLKFKKEILSDRKHGIRYPVKILLDQERGRLFVTESKIENKGQILIFEFR